MKDKKVIFMGTPEFALNALKVLNELTNVVLVVSKKDAYVGRKQILTPSPVKALAKSLNIPVLTPSNLKKEVKSIIEYEPDLIVTCAYGKILPKELLTLPKYGAINIHASLLPKYRGSAPMQWAILNGDEETGVTLMYMDEGMDTGDMIAKSSIKIEDDDNIGSIHDKLSILGANLLKENLENIFSGNIKRMKQNNEEATYAPMIEREMEEIDFSDTSLNIFNKIRAFSPYPLAKTNINGEEVKIVKAHYKLCHSEVGKLYLDKNSLAIGSRDGLIYLDLVKPASKREMDIKSYLNGKKGVLK